MDDVRVLVADPHALSRSGLRMLVDTAPGIAAVAEAGDLNAALDIAGDETCDVLVLAVGTDVDEVSEVIHRLSGADSTIRPAILVVADSPVSDCPYDMLRAGVNGVIMRDASPEQLTAAIRAVARDECVLDSELARRLVDDAIRGLPSQAVDTALSELTCRETDVLRLVAQGFSNREIGERLVISEATVKSHLGNVFKKLGVRDRAQAVTAAYEAGLVGINNGGVVHPPAV